MAKEAEIQENRSKVLPELFDFYNFAENLEALLTSESVLVDGSLVVSLNGRFGAGKSTFLDLWESRILAQESEKLNPHVIRINVWEEDYLDDPFASLIFSIVAGLARNKKSRLVDAAKTVAWFAVAGGSQLADKFTGLNPVAAGELAREKEAEREERDPHGGALWKLYHKRKDALAKLKKELRSAIRRRPKGVLILIDELDRCRPDYAIAFLETIKHVFDIDGLIFVLAVDRHQLEASTKSAFGNELVFSEYYRKFVNREVSVPRAGTRSIISYVEILYNRFLEIPGVRTSGFRKNSESVERLTELILAFDLVPRQTMEVFRICGFVLSSSLAPASDPLAPWVWEGVFLMAILKMVESDKYDLLKSSSFSVEEGAEYVRSRFGELSVQLKWFTYLVAAGAIRDSDSEVNSKFQRIAEKAGFDDLKSGRWVSTYCQFCESWQMLPGGLGEFSHRLETLSCWWEE